MFFGIKEESIILTHNVFFGYCYKYTRATGFVVQGHILDNYNQCWEGYFGNVIGYRLQVTLLKM